MPKKGYRSVTIPTQVEKDIDKIIHTGHGMVVLVNKEGVLPPYFLKASWGSTGPGS
jgi:hypothetical protein